MENLKGINLFYALEILKELYKATKRTNLLLLGGIDSFSATDTNQLIDILIDEGYIISITENSFNECKSIFHWYDYFFITKKGVLFIEDYFNITPFNYEF